MQELKFTAFNDERYEKKSGNTLSLPVIFESVKLDDKITYNKDKQLGSIGGSSRFNKYEPKQLELKFIIDCTGVVEGTKKTDKVYHKVKVLENLLYTYNSEGHHPSFVVVSYAEFIFKGVLQSMNTDYTLFSSKGIPLRAVVGLSFKGAMCSEEERKRYSKLSPDMSRLITVKEGETLPYLCHKIYGDSLLVRQVARFNNLNSFRNIPAGTELLFPPLKKE